MAGVEPSKTAASAKGAGPPKAARPSLSGPGSSLDRARTASNRDTPAVERPNVQVDRRLVCDVRGLEHPDLGTVDDLLKLALAAHRSGRELRLVNATAALRELVAFAGLSDVLVSECPSRQSTGRSGAGGGSLESDAGEGNPLGDR